MLYYIKDNNLVSASLKPKKHKEEEYRELARKAAPARHEIKGRDDFDEKFFSYKYGRELRDDEDYIRILEHWFGCYKSSGSIKLYYAVTDESIVYNMYDLDRLFSMKALYPNITLSFLSNKEHPNNAMLTLDESIEKSCDESFALNINLINMLGKDNSIELLEACFSAPSEEAKKILLYQCVEEFAIFYYELLPCVDISVEDTYDLSKIENYSDSIKAGIDIVLPIAESNSKVLNIINASKKN